MAAQLARIREPPGSGDIPHLVVGHEVLGHSVLPRDVELLDVVHGRKQPEHERSRKPNCNREPEVAAGKQRFAWR